MLAQEVISPTIILPDDIFTELDDNFNFRYYKCRICGKNVCEGKKYKSTSREDHRRKHEEEYQ